MVVTRTQPDNVLPEDIQEANPKGNDVGVAFIDIDDHLLAGVIYGANQAEADERADAIVAAMLERR